MSPAGWFFLFWQKKKRCRYLKWVRPGIVVCASRPRWRPSAEDVLCFQVVPGSTNSEEVGRSKVLPAPYGVALLVFRVALAVLSKVVLAVLSKVVFAVL